MTFFAVDKAIFYFFNRALSNPVLDAVMPFLTTERNWIVPLALAWLGLVVFGGRKGRETALLVVLILLVTDQVVNFVIKPAVGRERPCFVLEHVRLLIHQPHSRSFPSSHAANMAAMATLFSVRYRSAAAAFIAVAFCVGVSRIVVGVHYPSDVAAGFAAGSGFAVLVLLAWKRIRPRNAGNRGFFRTDRSSRGGHPSRAGG
jgi:undecaprenyl-diphosphatase